MAIKSNAKSESDLFVSNMRLLIPITILFVQLVGAFVLHTHIEVKVVALVTTIFFLTGATIGKFKSVHFKFLDVGTRYYVTSYALFILVVLVKYFKGHYELVTHRVLYWEDATYLFGNSQMFILYTWVMIPALSVRYLASNNVKNRVIFAVMLLVDSVISLSRFNILILLYGYFARKGVKISRLIFVSVSLIFIANLVLFFRLKDGDSNISLSFDWILQSQSSFFSAYVLGPVMVVEELMSSLPLNPLYLASGFMQGMNLVLNNFGMALSIENLDSFVISLSKGFFSEQLGVYVNAFFPSTYIVYKALGLLGVVLYSFINGLLFRASGVVAVSAQYLSTS